jgi:hypothetical protein
MLGFSTTSKKRQKENKQEREKKQTARDTSCDGEQRLKEQDKILGTEQINFKGRRVNREESVSTAGVIGQFGER